MRPLLCIWFGSLCLLTAAPTVPELVSGDPESVQVDPQRLQAAAGLVRQAVEMDDLRGAVVLVARRGRIILHEAYGWRDAEKEKPMERDSQFRMASNTKALTAAGIQLLAQDGHLNLDDPAYKFFPSFHQGTAERITLRHLLTHTSGLRIGSLFLKPLMEPSAEHPEAPSLQLEVARFGNVGPKVEPGTTYQYSNPGYNTLAGVIEVASGKPYKDFLRERIYQPLGMTDSFNHEPDANPSRMSAIFKSKKNGLWTVGWKPGDPPDYPFPRGSGGMISTARDFAVFCQMLLNDGTYGGRRILQEDLVRAMVNPQAQHIPAAKTYGLGWRVEKPGGVYSHSGSDGTFAWVDPERELIGLVFTQSPGAGPRNPRQEFKRRVTNACLDTRPAPLPIGNWTDHGFTPEQRKALRTAFLQGIERQVIPGGAMLLIHRGEIVFREAFGVADLESGRPFQVDTPCRIASLTKPHTATLIALLADRGLLSLSDPLDKYLPEFKDLKLADGKPPLSIPTLAQCLSHTAGFPGNDILKSGRSDLAMDGSLSEVVRRLAEAGLTTQPGTHYDYSRLGYMAAGRVAEKVTGRPFPQALEALLLDPIGAVDSGFDIDPGLEASMAVPYERDGRGLKPRTGDRVGTVVNPGGGLVATLDGVARLFLLHRNSGTLKGEPFVSRERLQSMYVRQPATGRTGYGLGFNILDTRPDGTASRVQHTGASGTIGILDLDRDLITIILTQVPQRQTQRWRRQVLQAVENLSLRQR